MILGRPSNNLLFPLCFILVMATWAGIWYIISYVNSGQWLLVVIQSAVIISSIFIILESWGTFQKLRAESSAGDDEESIAS